MGASSTFYSWGRTTRELPESWTIRQRELKAGGIHITHKITFTRIDKTKKKVGRERKKRGAAWGAWKTVFPRLLRVGKDLDN